MKRQLPIFLFLMFSVLGFAQKSLPAYMTEEEMQLLPAYRPPTFSGQVFTTPPSTPVRTMAEWEEIQSLTITWASHQQILREIVRHAKEEVEVIIVCSDSTNVKNYLAGYGITTHNLSFLQKPFNTIWIRDYGQHSVYKNDVDSLLLVDWIYNRPRPSDDQVPKWVADLKGLDLYATTQTPTDLVNTGGNFMADGLGTAFASELILDENDFGNPYSVSVKTEAAIDTIMKHFMGINRYIKMPTLPYDGIHHIDMHMKLLDEETILVGQYPQGVADGPQIEANINYILNNFTSPFGTPYRIVRIQMPPDASGLYPNNNGDYRTYTNSIFINKTVLVPTYAPQYDAAALEVYKKNLPGYKVVGINCNSIISLSGALHCITKEVGANDPLLIVHQPIRDTVFSSGNYNLTATLQHRSGIANATIFYTTDTLLGYQTSPMQWLNGDTWQGTIPDVGGGKTVFYYIQATANSGKTQSRPMPAPSGYWHFWIDQSVGTGAVLSNFSLSTIFPNPAENTLNLPIVVQKTADATVEIIDGLGRMVQTVFQGTLQEGEHLKTISIRHLPTGVYTVRVQLGGEIQTQLFIKK